MKVTFATFGLAAVLVRPLWLWAPRVLHSAVLPSLCGGVEMHTAMLTASNLSRLSYTRITPASIAIPCFVRILRSSLSLLPTATEQIQSYPCRPLALGYE